MSTEPALFFDGHHFGMMIDLLASCRNVAVDDSLPLEERQAADTAMADALRILHVSYKAGDLHNLCLRITPSASSVEARANGQWMNAEQFGEFWGGIPQ